jgi:pimeloyl-ACP methyl ester carboxylesterase
MSKLVYRLIMFVAITVGWPRPEAGAASPARSRTGTEMEAAEHGDHSPEHKREIVFLIHGIGKGRTDMLSMQSMLRRQGFEVLNWHYPSTRLTLDEIAELLNQQLEHYSDYKVSFVTHSMGGIVVRTYMNKYKPENVGRFIMIAPPNQGAYLASLLGNWLPYKLILGPAGQQLREGEDGRCACAGKPNCEFAIIAGGTGKDRGMNPLIPGDDDGTVSVESTRLEGAADFLVLPYAHPIIQMMPRTARNVVSFLRTGKFAEHSPLPGTNKSTVDTTPEKPDALLGS